MLYTRMSLGSWFNGMASALSPAKESVVNHIPVVILSELDCQMRDAEEKVHAFQQAKKRIEMGGIDYSWLVTKKPEFYKISEQERLELEELCRRVTASECGAVIRSFREAIVGEDRASEMPEILRSVIHQVIEARPQTTPNGTMPQWLSRSFTSLKTLHATIRNNSVSSAESTDFNQQRQERSPSMELATFQSLT